MICAKKNNNDINFSMQDAVSHFHDVKRKETPQLKFPPERKFINQMSHVGLNMK